MGGRSHSLCISAGWGGATGEIRSTPRRRGIERKTEKSRQTSRRGCPQRAAASCSISTAPGCLWLFSGRQPRWPTPRSPCQLQPLSGHGATSQGSQKGEGRGGQRAAGQRNVGHGRRGWHNSWPAVPGEVPPCWEGSPSRPATRSTPPATRSPLPAGLECHSPTPGQSAMKRSADW